MTKMEPTLSWLDNPEIFEVNRIEAHSDHLYYPSWKKAFSNEEMEWRSLLNGVWKFSYAKNPAGRQKDFYKMDYDITQWDDIKVPGHIQLQGYDQIQYVNLQYPWDGHAAVIPPQISEEDNPSGSYIKEFEIPKEWKGMRIFISFQGVENAFYSWVNGEFLGYGEDSFTPSEFEITDYIKAGTNRLAVEVYKRSTGTWLEDQDFWRFSGIFRDVYLYAVPCVHVRDLFVKTELNDSFTGGVLNVDLSFLNGGVNHTEGFVTLQLYDRENHLVAAEDLLPVKENMSVSMKVSNVKLWSGENPYLYELMITVIGKNDEVVEVVPQPVGFRRFEMKNGVMYLNGVRVVFKGINRHEFSHRHGRAVTKEEMLWDIRFMKRNNINAVRTSHYPNHSYWYQLCDEFGIYLIDETNLETHGTWQRKGGYSAEIAIPHDRPEWKAIILDRAKSMLERDKNHPSILIWSCGNEAFGGINLYEMSQWFRKRDSLRLVHYEGVWNDKRYPDTTDMMSRMYAKPDEIGEYLKSNPEKPYISCEYSHAMGNSCGGLSLYTDLEEQYEKYQGGFIWDYIDQSLEKIRDDKTAMLTYGGDYGDRPNDNNFCTNGIVFSDRTYSPKVQEVRYLYQDLKVIPSEKGVLVKNRHLFTNTNVYDMIYSLKRDGMLVESGKIETYVRPQSEQFILFPSQKQTEDGEYTVEVSFRLKADTCWAEKGYEIAFGQYTYGVYKREKSTSKSGKLRVVDGDYNIGIHGEHFSVLFAKGNGLTSLRYHGEEYIEKPPYPLFFRPSTDNDKGNRMPFRMAEWQIASSVRSCVGTELQETKDFTAVRFIYKFPILKEFQVSVLYSVYPDGSVKVTAEYPGTSQMKEIPLFGLQMRLNKKLDAYEYYGNGPDENYIDRNKGARLGIYKNTVSGSYVPYSIPQECGNRTGVRWWRMTEGNGNGITFTAHKDTLEMSALPWSSEEMEQALHKEELPPYSYTNVRVLAKQMGVGGDDSWGALVQKPYRISAKKKIKLEFWMKCEKKY